MLGTSGLRPIKEATACFRRECRVKPRARAQLVTPAVYIHIPSQNAPIKEERAFQIPKSEPLPKEAKMQLGIRLTTLRFRISECIPPVEASVYSSAPVFPPRLHRRETSLQEGIMDALGYYTRKCHTLLTCLIHLKSRANEGLYVTLSPDTTVYLRRIELGPGRV